MRVILEDTKEYVTNYEIKDNVMDNGINLSGVVIKSWHDDI